MFIKTRTKHASKDEIELAVFKAFREVLIEGIVLRVRGRGTGPRSLARSIVRRWVLPRLHRDLRRIQTNTQSIKRNKSFIVELKSEIIKIWSSE